MWRPTLLMLLTLAPGPLGASPLQSTYLGGGTHDVIFGIAVHPTTGEVYVAGHTESFNFPGTTGGVQAAFSFPLEAFVARFDPGLTTLKQATFFGGGSFDFAYAIAIHPTNGDVYITGSTSSDNLPGSTGGAQPAKGSAGAGSSDCFVARFDPSLTVLRQSTFLGGSAGDECYALSIHPGTGEVYVAGDTVSPDFPGTAGGAQPSVAGSGETFVARLNAELTELRQATYLGGGAFDQARTIAVQPSTGEVVVAGFTFSSDFPGTAGGAQAVAGGDSDAFVARLDASLTSLRQASYLGGSAREEGLAVAIHPSTGEVYLAGFTYSANFPGTAGGAQAAPGGTAGGDAFVARLDPSLTSLRQATYFGGGAEDVARAISFAPGGVVYLTGNTGSADLPGTNGALQPVKAFSHDAFVARLSASLTSLQRATYRGGNSLDEATGVALDGTVFIAGYTESTVFPGTLGGAQPANAGRSDAFVSRLPADLGPLPCLTVTKVAPGAIHPGDSLTYTLKYGNVGTADAQNVVIRDPLPSGSSFVSATNGGTNVAGVVTWNLGTVPAGLTDQSVSFTVNPTVTDGSIQNAGYTIEATGTEPLAGPAVTTVVGTGPRSSFLYTLPPCRAVDTRQPDGPLGGPALVADTPRSFTLAGTCGIPADAHAVVSNVTVTQPTAAGYLQLFAAGTSAPDTSVLSFAASTTRASNAIVSLGESGAVTAICKTPSGTAHLIVDVSGYFR